MPLGTVVVTVTGTVAVKSAAGASTDAVSFTEPCPAVGPVVYVTVTVLLAPIAKTKPPGLTPVIVATAPVRLALTLQEEFEAQLAFLAMNVADPALFVAGLK